MYHTCIFCAADLGSNDAIEAFPVGHRVAFDAWRGRLWAICPRCRRWNLAPLEERWEAVEAAERLFRDARLRVQSENVGLAKVPDGTRLVRVGEALPGELAAWRYGDVLTRRRRRYALGIGAAVTAPALVFGGLWAMGAGAVATGAWNLGSQVVLYRQSRRIVHRLDTESSPTGEPWIIRRSHLNGARILPDERGFALELPRGAVAESGREPLVLTGRNARSVLGRAMVSVNDKGAKRDELGAAIDLLAERGGAEAYLRGIAEQAIPVGVPRVMDYHGRLGSPLKGARGAWRAVADSFRGVPVSYTRLPAERMDTLDGRPAVRLPKPESLALEMALHEEAERRALEGELAELEAAWREAEEIADIADSLLDVPGLERLRRGREG